MNGFYSLTSYTLLPFTCGFIVIVLGYIKFWKLRKIEHPETVGIFGIWLIGIIGFLLGIFGQVLSLIDTFDSIAKAENISPSIVAEGIRSSFKSTLFGFTVLVISLIVWGILKGAKEKRIMSKTISKD